MPRLLLNLSWRHAACFSFGTAIAPPAATTIDNLSFRLERICHALGDTDRLHRWTGREVVDPRKRSERILITAAIGIVGSLHATYGGQALGLYNAGEPAGFIGSVVGAVIVLAIYYLVTRKSATAT
jgi:uncharacterized membrane protein YeaQ/YmgE (transglycosylase-associated protein family)